MAVAAVAASTFAGAQFLPLLNLSSTYIANQTFTNTFTPFAGSATLPISISGTPLGTSPTLAASPGAAASIALSVKTPVLYLDPLYASQGYTVLTVLYTAADALGRVAVAPSPVTLAVSGASASGASCTAFTQSSTTGTCTAAVSGFSTTGNVSATATVSVNGISSAPAAFTLAQVPVHAAPPASAMGGYAYLPQAPVFAGDAITINLWAQTGTNALGGLDVRLYYNTALFTAATLSAPLFSAAVGSNTTNQLSFTLSTLSTAPAASVTGWFQVRKNKSFFIILKVQYTILMRYFLVANSC